jgi:hypothetical protein
MIRLAPQKQKIYIYKCSKVSVLGYRNESFTY